MKLFQNSDGANPQAQAVLAYLAGFGGIEESYEDRRFLAEPTVARWYNCREQGYVVSMRSRRGNRQINIAFFEHRNSDGICALEWEQVTTYGNPPNLSDMPRDLPWFEDKYAVSHEEEWGRAAEMAHWIFDRLTAFWIETSTDKVVAKPV